MSDGPQRVDSVTAVARVDGQAVSIPADLGESVDVEFDGRRVWSIPGSGTGRVRGSLRIVAWPRLLRPHLNGAARVVVRESAGGRVLLDEERVFGTGKGRVSFVDAHGRPRVIDKWGFVQTPLSARGEGFREPALDTAEAILAVLAQDCGRPAWIAFGSLLGAVREGRVIGHDSDLDLAYLSAHENPVDVAREMFAITRALRSRGLRVITKTAGFVTVLAALPDGSRFPIDVYACFYVGERLYETASVGAPVPRSALLPLGRVRLEGRELPAPARPEVLLEASYGPGWRIPDPGFRYETPDALRQRFLGWFGTSMRYRRYWDRLYDGAFGYRITREPSPFARWVEPLLEPGSRVVDVGCGNGRDSLWLASHGHRVVGVDYSRAGLARCRAAAAKGTGTPAEFRLLNLYDLRDTLGQGALLARDLPGPRVVYARFLLHALEPVDRPTFWRLADLLLRGGGRAYLEFRTDRDRLRPRAYERHFCAYPRADDICAEAEAAGGRVLERTEGSGLARHEREDPVVCRLVVEWTR